MSKKIFLPIIVFLSFFLFQNSVNAESSPSWQSNDLKFYNLGSMSDEEKTTVLGNEYIYYTRAKTYAINSCGTDSYYIYRNTNGGGFNVACFNQTDYKGASITV